MHCPPEIFVKYPGAQFEQTDTPILVKYDGEGNVALLPGHAVHILDPFPILVAAHELLYNVATCAVDNTVLNIRKSSIDP